MIKMTDFINIYSRIEDTTEVGGYFKTYYIDRNGEPNTVYCSITTNKTQPLIKTIYISRILFESSSKEELEKLSAWVRSAWMEAATNYTISRFWFRLAEEREDLSWIK